MVFVDDRVARRMTVRIGALLVDMRYRRNGLVLLC